MDFGSGKECAFRREMIKSHIYKATSTQTNTKCNRNHEKINSGERIGQHILDIIDFGIMLAQSAWLECLFSK